MDLTTTVSIRLDQKTVDFLERLRTEEQINISAWVRDAIRQKAGLSPNSEPEILEKSA